MSTILFVDDEESVLRSYKRTFRKVEHELLFAESGAEALTHFEDHTIDVIISDIRMPEMDGFELLTKVKSISPNTMRLVVSGYSDRECMIKSVIDGLVHIYMNKPWDNTTLIAYVEQLLHFRAHVNNEELRATFDSKVKLPELSEHYNRIISQLNSGAPLKEIAKLISESVALTASFLRIANSAFYNLQTTDIQQALVYIGTNGIRNLLTLIEVCEIAAGVEQRLVASIQDHSIRCNQILDRLYVEYHHKHMPKELQTVGLLHEIGSFFCLASGNEQFNQSLSTVKNEGDLLQLEQELFGYSHDIIGGFLLEWWNMPFDLYRIIYLHHQRIPEITKEWEDIALLQLADYGERLKAESEIDVYHSGLLKSLDMPIENYRALLQ